MSESAAASALCPTSAYECVASVKCTPSASASTDVAATPPPRTTAASSPGPASTRFPGRRSAASIAAISSSSDIVQQSADTATSAPLARGSALSSVGVRGLLGRQGTAGVIVLLLV